MLKTISSVEEVHSELKVVAWQERQYTGKKWTNWYDCKSRKSNAVLTKTVDGIQYEWRKLITLASAEQCLAKADQTIKSLQAQLPRPRRSRFGSVVDEGVSNTLTFGGRCQKHPLEIKPCQICAEKEKFKEQGICPECEGDGEQGGQFCGGYWKCEACDGSGKYTTKN